MISNFLKGQKAARLGFCVSLCMLDGEARKEWMEGYKSYKPEPSVAFDAQKVSEEFALKHFKDEKS